MIASANLYMGDWSVWGNQLWFKDFDSKSTVRIGGSAISESNSKLNLDNKAHKIKNDFSTYLQFFIGSLLKDKPNILLEFCGIDI